MSKNALIQIFFAYFLSLSCGAFSYVGMAGNYSKINYELMEQYNVEPTGSGLSYIFGVRSGFLGLEFSYIGTDASGDIIHDNVSNTINHNQKSYTVNMNAFINTRLYFKFGYGLYKIKNTLETDVASYTRDAITEKYGLKNESHNGLTYGLGFNFFKKNNGFNIYTSVDRYQYDSQGTTTTVQLGVKYLFKAGLGSIIGK